MATHPATRWFLVAGGVVLTVLGYASAIKRFFDNTEWPQNTDFGIYLAAADAMARGLSPYEMVGEFKYVYPPLLADILLVLRTVLEPQALWALWSGLSVVALFATIAMLLRSFGPRYGWPWVIFLGGVVMTGVGMRADLYHGQINVFLTFLLVCGYAQYRQGRITLASALWAVMIVCKPFLGIVAIFMLWKRQYRAAILTVLMSGTLFAASFLPTFPHVIDVVRGWMAVSKYASAEFAPIPDNGSLNGLFMRMFTPNDFATPWIVQPGLVGPVMLAVVLLAGAIFVMATPRRAPTGSPVEAERTALMEMGLVLSLMMACGPLTEGDHLFFALPGAAATAMIALERLGGRQRRAGAWLVATGLWASVFLTLLSPKRLTIAFITPDTWPLLNGPGLLLSGRVGFTLLAASALTALLLWRERREAIGVGAPAS